MRPEVCCIQSTYIFDNSCSKMKSQNENILYRGEHLLPSKVKDDIKQLAHDSSRRQLERNTKHKSKKAS